MEDNKPQIKLYTALLGAQKEMGKLVKDSQNPHLKNKYASLAAVLETIREPLNNNGLVLYQSATTVDDGTNMDVVVNSALIHAESGEMVSERIMIPLTKNSAQEIGSAITYGRRYLAIAMCGLAPEDDDGQAATDAQRKPQQQAVRPPSAQRQQAPQAQHRRVDTETGEITNNVNPFDDAPTEGPNDDELAILSTWKNPQDAQAWAVEIKACENEHHARESFKKIVDANGGKLTKENIGTVYLQFLRRQNEKLEQEKAAM